MSAEVYEEEAQWIPEEPESDNRYPLNPEEFGPYEGREAVMPMEQPQEHELFQRQTDLRVIQEYNREENMPIAARRDFWALASKSIKLGFWDNSDERELFLHKNIIRLGYMMSKPRHRYTFADRQVMNQMDMLVYADFKRGVGMEKYKINERTLQATSVTQNIQGGGGAGAAGKRGGVLAGIKNFFG